MNVRLLSTSKAATFLGLSVETVRRKCREGVIESILLPSGRYRITKQAIADYLNVEVGSIFE